MKERGRKAHFEGGGKQREGRGLLFLANDNKRALTMCGGCCMLTVQEKRMGEDPSPVARKKGMIDDAVDISRNRRSQYDPQGRRK